MSAHALHPGPVPAQAPVIPIAAQSIWQRLDRIGSYIFAAVIFGVGVVAPFAIMIYGFFRGDGF